MLTLKILREQPEFVIERLAVKNFDASQIVKDILEADAQRRAAQTKLDATLAEQNLPSLRMRTRRYSGSVASSRSVPTMV